MSRQTVAATCGFAAALWALMVPLLGGVGHPGYSHAAHYISELGATGAANAALVGMLGFAPTGLLVILFLMGARFPDSWQARAGVVGVGAVGTAYIVSAFAPCDPGCPAEGSLPQLVHNVFGVAEYVGASVGLSLMASAFGRSAPWRPLRLASVVCAVLVMIGFAGMLTPALAGYRGICQRLAEASIFLWIAASALWSLRSR